MTLNNPPVPGPQSPGVLPAAPPKAPPRTYTARERALVGVAAALALLCDRLLFARIWSAHAPFFAGIFWLAAVAVVYVLYWQRLRRNKVLWIVGGLTGLLCVWNLLFDYRSSFGLITFLVIPCVLMAHLQVLAGGHSLGQAGAIARDWLLGWFVRPFSGMVHLVGAAGSLGSEGRGRSVKKALLGALLACLLLLVVVPLLGGADMVFRYYLLRMFRYFSLGSLVGHLFLIAASCLVIYSLLWNAGFAQKKAAAAKPLPRVDVLVYGVVLGAVVAVYLLFCAVQFTYLFAGAGLPGNMTYSEYAREGFAQIIAVCAINLLLFGTFLQLGARSPVRTALLAALLGVTAVMLVSGFVRLFLYIETYGLTWLRLLSAWFLIYLAAVLVLCAVRMARERLPVVGLCALLLLGWYTALGYANPEALIVRHNVRASAGATAWAAENSRYARRMSDDGKRALILAGAENWEEFADAYSGAGRGYSLSSRRTGALVERRRAEKGE